MVIVYSSTDEDTGCEFSHCTTGRQAGVWEQQQGYSIREKEVEQGVYGYFGDRTVESGGEKGSGAAFQEEDWVGGRSLEVSEFRGEEATSAAVQAVPGDFGDRTLALYDGGVGVASEVVVAFVTFGV